MTEATDNTENLTLRYLHEALDLRAQERQNFVPADTAELLAEALLNRHKYNSFEIGILTLTQNTCYIYPSPQYIRDTNGFSWTTTYSLKSRSGQTYNLYINVDKASLIEFLKKG